MKEFLESGDPSLDSFIVHRKNRIGFRGNELPDYFEEYLTVITVGGSTTECYYVSDGDTWTDHLGRTLGANFTNFWINNAGLDGHSTYGHIVLMEDHIVAIKPKVVLFLTGLNEDHSTLNQFDARQQTKTLADYSEIFSVILNLVRAARARRIAVPHQLDLNITERVHMQDDPQMVQDLLLEKLGRIESYGRRLQRLIHICRSNDIKPVIITQPALFGTQIDEYTGVDLTSIKVSTISGSTAWVILESFNNKARQVAREQGVLIIDLAKELPKNSRYFYDFGHYSSEGCKKVAEIIYQSLCPHLAQIYPGSVKAECK